MTVVVHRKLIAAPVFLFACDNRSLSQSGKFHSPNFMSFSVHTILTFWTMCIQITTKFSALSEDETPYSKYCTAVRCVSRCRHEYETNWENGNCGAPNFVNRPESKMALTYSLAQLFKVASVDVNTRWTRIITSACFFCAPERFYASPVGMALPSTQMLLIF